MADILAFSPHPDDVEIGAGGTLALHSRLGYDVVVCDLTQGELASNGTPAERAREAALAARILGLGSRETLGLADRALEPTPDRVRVVAEAVRRWRPRVVLAPWGEDRHPDHGAAARLVREGVFNAGLVRYRAAGEAHRVARLVYYLVNSTAAPGFVVDISRVYDLKRQALEAYASQFSPAGEPTPLNRGYLEWVELRDRWYGSLAGVERAEGFRWEGLLRLQDLVREL
ncbi:MAG TPA: bacillithiol biosynthesis deacetylase BshB1 [Clostridiales bacterium]|nr:bacillithiol biosynthesis deacetylase BshB1 [Clostridiales bacterium]